MPYLLMTPDIVANKADEISENWAYRATFRTSGMEFDGLLSLVQ
jgi:hypothetical protein